MYENSTHNIIARNMLCNTCCLLYCTIAHTLSNNLANHQPWQPPSIIMSLWVFVVELLLNVKLTIFQLYHGIISNFFYFLLQRTWEKRQYHFFTLWVRIPLMERCTRYNIMRSNLSMTRCRSVVFSTNKIDHHDIAEILLKVALNTITHHWRA